MNVRLSPGWPYLLLPAALLAAISAGPAAAADLVLARVGGEPITLEQLMLDFERRHQGHMSMLGDEQVVRDFLNSAIRRRLFVQEGRRAGLAEDPDIRAAVERERSRLASDWLYRTEIRSAVRLSDGEVESAIEAMRKGRDVVRVLTDTREQALEARRRILDGEPAEDVAREMSYAASHSRGGVERIGWGLEEPHVEAAVFAAVDGELLGPLETDQGWLVLRVRAASEHEVEPRRARPMAENVLKKRREVERRAAYLDALRERYRAEVHEQLVDPHVLVPRVEAGEQAEPDGRPVAQFAGGRITLDEFARGIRPRVFLALRPDQQRRMARQLLSDRLDAELLRLEGERRWAEVPREERVKANVLEDELIYLALLDRVVLRDLEVSDAEIHDWYESHRGDYVDPPQVRLAIALLGSEAEARSLLDAARQGQPFEELARQRSRDHATAERGGQAGWVVPDRVIAPLRRVFDEPAGTLGEPVEVEQGWLVYTVLERRESRQLPEEQVRDKIRERLLQAKTAEVMTAWEGRLREATPVKVRESALRKAGRLLAEQESERYRLSADGAPAAHGPAEAPPPADGPR